MKIDFSKPMLALSAKAIKVTDLEGEPEFTIRDVATNALTAETQDNTKLDGKEKIKRFRLAERIYGCKEPIKLSAEDIVLVKEQINKIYGITVTTRAWDILDGNDEEVPAAAPTPVPAE